MHKRLLNLRRQIDEIDETIVRLLVKRLDLVKQVGDFKKELNLPAEDPEREEEIIQRLTESTGGRLPRDQIVRIFKSIFAATKRGQK